MKSEIKIKKRGDGLKKFIKKYGYFIAVAAIVLVVTLSVVLTQNKGQTPTIDLEIGNQEATEVGSAALSFELPLLNCKVAHDYSRDALIFNETMGWFETHKGVDLISETSAEVLASEKGEVVNVYTNTLEGTVVVVKHNDSMSTKYSSLDSNVNVKVGDKVTKGQKLGTISVSASEEASTGAHLHFELLQNDNQINPNDYLNLQSK